MEKDVDEAFAFEIQHPTADWKPLAHCNYRKRELYDLEWNVDLAKVTVVGAPFGGPLAISRDEKQILLITGDQPLKPQTQIFTSSGVPISSILWESNKGRVVKMGWILEERLVFVMESGVVLIYNIHGEMVSTFSLGQDCSQQGVLQCHFWSNGLVVMTNALRFYAVPNLSEPKVRLLADPGLQQPPVSWCIVEPEFSASHQVEVIISTPSASIIVLNADRATDLKFVSMGPFLKMTVSPAGDYVACFAEDGHMLVVQIDFAKSASRFDTQSKKPPKHLVWCGSDAVLMYWPGVGVLMVGPAPDAWYRYAYDEPVQLIPECDGARIITNHKCEFLQRVPKVTEAIFGIGSTTAAATLYDAVVDFQRKSPKADEGIRSIRTELSDAVEACIEAAGHEFSPIMQRRLLKAASFGKSFLETYDADLFVDMCKTLRVLNSVRQPDVGIPLTFQQYKLLTPKRLVECLINRHHHALAWHICGYLSLKRDAVLVHWACLKVRSEGTEKEILSTIVNKLQAVPAISFAEIASAAYRSGRTELATKLLDYEPRAAEQVPLLITMQEDELALAKAIQSGDTDLVYLVLLHVRRSRSAVDFFRMLKGRPEALDLLIAYCKQQDLDLLKDIYYQAAMPQESANIAVLEAYQNNDLDKRIRGLQIALNLYKDTKEAFAAKATETQIRLLLQQRELEAAIPDSEFVGCSLSDTLYRLIRTGYAKQAAKIRGDFKVPDKRYWWIQIKALAMARSWPELEALANSKKSPIGYRPFAEVCIDQGALGEAVKYIARLADPVQKVEMLTSINRWREAAEAAMELKPDQAVPLLEDIRNRCPERAEQHNITQLLQSLLK